MTEKNEVNIDKIIEIQHKHIMRQESALTTEDDEKIKYPRFRNFKMKFNDVILETSVVKGLAMTHLKMDNSTNITLLGTFDFKRYLNDAGNERENYQLGLKEKISRQINNNESFYYGFIKK